MALSKKTNTAVQNEDEYPREELIRHARQEDAAAWETLVRIHQEPVFRLAYLILGDATEAEDVTQEVFVRAYLSLDKFDVHRPFRPWILQITRNLARNRRRSIGRYWVHLKRWWQQQPLPVDRQSFLDPTDAQMLWQAVRRLQTKGQEVIYLRYFLQLSEAETAEALGIPAGTVKSRLHRALRQLRTVIEIDFPQLRQ